MHKNIYHLHVLIFYLYIRLYIYSIDGCTHKRLEIAALINLQKHRKQLHHMTAAWEFGHSPRRVNHVRSGNNLLLPCHQLQGNLGVPLPIPEDGHQLFTSLNQIENPESHRDKEHSIPVVSERVRGVFPEAHRCSIVFTTHVAEPEIRQHLIV